MGFEPSPKQENGGQAPPAPVSPVPTSAMLRARPRLLVRAGAAMLVALVFARVHFLANVRLHPVAGSAYPTFNTEPGAVVTVPGSVRHPALPPDGKQIAFTWRSATQLDHLYVQLIDIRAQLTRKRFSLKQVSRRAGAKGGEGGISTALDMVYRWPEWRPSAPIRRYLLRSLQPAGRPPITSGVAGLALSPCLPETDPRSERRQQHEGDPTWKARGHNQIASSAHGGG